MAYEALLESGTAVEPGELMQLAVYPETSPEDAAVLVIALPAGTGAVARGITDADVQGWSRPLRATVLLRGGMTLVGPLAPSPRQWKVPVAAVGHTSAAGHVSVVAAMRWRLEVRASVMGFGLDGGAGTLLLASLSPIDFHFDVEVLRRNRVALKSASVTVQVGVPELWKLADGEETRLQLPTAIDCVGPPLLALPAAGAGPCIGDAAARCLWASSVGDTGGDAAAVVTADMTFDQRLAVLSYNFVADLLPPSGMVPLPTTAAEWSAGIHLRSTGALVYPLAPLIGSLGRGVVMMEPGSAEAQLLGRQLAAGELELRIGAGGAAAQAVAVLNNDALLCSYGPRLGPWEVPVGSGLDTEVATPALERTYVLTASPVVNWELVPGRDADKFRIVGDTGTLRLGPRGAGTEAGLMLQATVRAIDPEAARSDECTVEVLVCSPESLPLFGAAPYHPLIEMPTATAFGDGVNRVAVGQIDVTNPTDELAACSGVSGPFTGQLVWTADALGIELGAAPNGRGALTIFALPALATATPGFYTAELAVLDAVGTVRGSTELKIELASGGGGALFSPPVGGECVELVSCTDDVAPNLCAGCAAEGCAPPFGDATRCLVQTTAVREDAAIGTELARLQPLLGVQNVVCTLLDASPGCSATDRAGSAGFCLDAPIGVPNGASAFRVDGSTAAVTVAAALDFEAIQKMALYVHCTADGGSAAATARLDVLVTDVGAAPVVLGAIGAQLAAGRWFAGAAATPIFQLGLNGEGGIVTARFWCQLPGQAFERCDKLPDGAGSTAGATLRAPGLGPGVHTLGVRAEPDGGGAPEELTLQLVVDGSAPLVTVQGGPPNSSSEAAAAFVLGVVGSGPASGGQGSPVVVEYSLDGAAWVELSVSVVLAPEGPGEAARLGVALPPVADGLHRVEWRVADIAGNDRYQGRGGEPPPAYAWLVDTVVPLVALSAVPDAVVPGGVGTMMVKYFAGDPRLELQCALDNAAAAACDAGADGVGSAVVPTDLPPGLHRFKVSTTGGEAAATAAWQVLGPVQPGATVANPPTVRGGDVVLLDPPDWEPLVLTADAEVLRFECRAVAAEVADWPRCCLAAYGPGSVCIPGCVGRIVDPRPECTAARERTVQQCVAAAAAAAPPLALPAKRVPCGSVVPVPELLEALGARELPPGIALSVAFEAVAVAAPGLAPGSAASAAWVTLPPLLPNRSSDGVPAAALEEKQCDGVPPGLAAAAALVWLAWLGLVAYGWHRRADVLAGWNPAVGHSTPSGRCARGLTPHCARHRLRGQSGCSPRASFLARRGVRPRGKAGRGSSPVQTLQRQPRSPWAIGRCTRCPLTPPSLPLRRPADEPQTLAGDAGFIDVGRGGGGASPPPSTPSPPLDGAVPRRKTFDIERGATSPVAPPRSRSPSRGVVAL